MKSFNLSFPKLLAIVLSISFLTFSCSQEEENDNPSDTQAQVDQEEERERERSEMDKDCWRGIGELHRGRGAVFTIPYRRVVGHFREELGLPIDNVKINYTEGSRIHWLIGIGRNDEGGKELLAVELALQQGKTFVLSGAVNERDGFYTITIIVLVEIVIIVISPGIMKIFEVVHVKIEIVVVNAITAFLALIPEWMES